MLPLPTTIRDRYRLDACIGSGGSAVVYRGEDLLLERPVAVKVVDDVQTVETQPFAREIAALSHLSHAGIVRLYDGGTDGAIAYLVMELVDGQALDELLAAEGALDQSRVRALGHQTADALAHAHAAGRVHRDVKPANLLLDRAGRVRVTDFGVARIADATATATARTIGTAAYLAPEQVRDGRVGPAADVYSLGLVLLECLTGERPFPGPPAEAALARLQRDPVVPGHLPEPWPELLTAMTAREPALRPPAAEVARRLRTRVQGPPAAQPPAAPASVEPEASADPAAATAPWAPASPDPPEPVTPAATAREAAASPSTGADTRIAPNDRPAATAQSPHDERPPGGGGHWLVAAVLVLLAAAGWLLLEGADDAPGDETAEEAGVASREGDIAASSAAAGASPGEHIRREGPEVAEAGPAPPPPPAPAQQESGRPVESDGADGPVDAGGHGRGQGPPEEPPGRARGHGSEQDRPAARGHGSGQGNPGDDEAGAGAAPSRAHPPLPPRRRRRRLGAHRVAYGAVTGTKLTRAPRAKPTVSLMVRLSRRN